jgi:hypothetical protein
MIAALSPAFAILVIMLLVAPIWPYSRGWGWTWVGILGLGAGSVVLFTLAAIDWS